MHCIWKLYVIPCSLRRFEIGPQISLDYYIEVEEIKPVLGKFRFAAKPVVSKHFDESKFPEAPPLKEFWGETEGDAQAKVREAMKVWATAQAVVLREL